MLVGRAGNGEGAGTLGNPAQRREDLCPCRRAMLQAYLKRFLSSGTRYLSEVGGHTFKPKHLTLLPKLFFFLGRAVSLVGS